MSHQIADIKDLKLYLEGVTDRINDHASNVHMTAMVLIGLIVTNSDPDSIFVREQDGNFKNIIWFSSNKCRWCAAYNHNTESIEIRAHSLQGNAAFSINDTTLQNLFSRLSTWFAP